MVWSTGLNYSNETDDGYSLSLKSNLTMASNEYPGFLLPTINVSEELKKQQ
ncbi:hypothetical protein IV64_GL000979 [Lactiplantibacillus xiangfangensis]|uniref:Uncharacterized protein n=1 Tax=Lactiplantibacillus xiangfangensis TaxID=942150 RepID=A0A0R2MSV2_9LACO|nr:hypothetical protein IV64_GL000979 [Lactiplantibacillus xiangfangensis]